MRLREKTGKKAPCCRDEHGMALVITLLIVSIITALVVEFAYGVYINTNALHNWQTAQRLSLVAKSATRLGAKLIAERSVFDPYTAEPAVISQKIPFEETDGTITLRIEDENSKFNLNSLASRDPGTKKKAHDSLVIMLTVLDLKTDIADRITDWTDSDGEPTGLRDAEYSAKNGNLDSIDELRHIPGVDMESYEKLFPYITIYGDGLININSAAVPVLMSLSNAITRGMAECVVSHRETAPFKEKGNIVNVCGFVSIGTGLQSYITTSGTSFRMLATAESGKIKRVIESVIAISGSSRTIRYWKES